MTVSLLPNTIYRRPTFVLFGLMGAVSLAYFSACGRFPRVASSVNVREAV